MEDSLSKRAGFGPVRCMITAAALFLTSQPLTAQQGLFGDDQPPPSVTLASTDIRLDVPTPTTGNDFAALLAQASSGGLSEMKQEAAERFSNHLRQAMQERLRQYLRDEEVPLVEQGGQLTLHTQFDAGISKQLTELKSSDRYETERGTLLIGGGFLYRLSSADGKSLREERIDLGELRLQPRYKVRTDLRSGEVEDSTDEAIEESLEKMAERLLDRIEDQLEADALRQFSAAG
ncbi:hypothetical protein Maes01_01248 [Microbulbifer aestuariivivens]|uniref:Curli production assembly/transport component CsgG n=1 Tax=Microbulbifer aestuariivivens TaxID=1908308 RepID=A0ABP9WQI8_9GAMM